MKRKLVLMLAAVAAFGSGAILADEKTSMGVGLASYGLSLTLFVLSLRHLGTHQPLTHTHPHYPDHRHPHTRRKRGGN